MIGPLGENSSILRTCVHRDHATESHTLSPYLQRMARSYQDHGSSLRRGSHFASVPTRYRSLGERLCTTRMTQSATRVASIPVRSPPTMTSSACCRAVSYAWAVSLGRCGGSRFSERIAPGSTIETEIPSDLTSWRSDSE